uniref:Uncharacterized protein n=1 Tax=Panagrolaimus davidi TaxID=227884 RepID=A0A914PYH4_9BILA
MGIKRFDQNRFIIADAYFGIYLVNLKLDHAEQIIKPSANDENDNLTNVECAFFNDVAVLNNDTIIFSCSSSRWGVGLAFHMLLEHKIDGKLQLTVENATPQIFIDNLPGLPDNIRITSENNYFVGLAVHRSSNYFSIFDFMGHYPWARKMFIEWIPESFINTYLPKLTKKYGFVIEFDESGNTVETFQDPTGETVNYISEVVESNGTLYLGSFKDDYIAKVLKNMGVLTEI